MSPGISIQNKTLQNALDMLEAKNRLQAMLIFVKTMILQTLSELFENYQPNVEIEHCLAARIYI